MNAKRGNSANHVFLLHVFLVFGVVGLLTTGCTDNGAETVVGSNAEDAGIEQTPVKSTSETCEVIDFNNLGHGDALASASVFGTSLDFTAERYSPGAATGIQPRGFDTNLDGNTVEDSDLVYQNGDCPNCDGLGRILVIPAPNFNEEGDHRHGGEITVSGFPGSNFYLKSFIAIDDDSNEPPIRVFVDGTKIGESSSLGNGTVETVSFGSATPISDTLRFVMGTEEVDNVTGSGAVDDFQICREVVGDEGCTLGYWKTHTGDGPGNQANAWAATNYEKNDQLGEVFDIPDAFDLDTATFYEALSFRGGPDATAAARLLLKQAVAALLNASHPDVAYGMTISQIVSDVNKALATEDRQEMLELKDQLDELNKASCPL